MLKRKKKKKKLKKRAPGLFGSRKKNKDKAALSSFNWSLIPKLAAVICILVAIGFGLVFLERYIETVLHTSQTSGRLKLIEVPTWVNPQLTKKVFTAATAGGETLKLDKDTALSVQQNLESLVAWLDNINVQLINDFICIKAKWRKPLALVKLGRKKFYIDAELTALDFLPLPNLPIVEVKGLSTKKKPPIGTTWPLDDLAAAVLILEKLEQMDELIVPEKPLLYEIDRIDVSNFDGRKNSQTAHILLYTKDDTKIIWGAQIGSWQQHLEMPDKEKLASLYGYYKEFGSLMSGAKYINLRDPQDRIYQPIDKY